MSKRLLLIGFVVVFLSSFSFGQIVTTIADVQDTTGGAGGGASHLDGQTVTVEGVVSAEIWAYGSSYYIQDGSGPWSGVYVYDSGRENAYGDSVRITATVSEYYDLTQLSTVTEYVKLDSGKTVTPTVVTTGEIATGGSNAEAYEGVLVRVRHVDITNPSLGYGEWEIDDGSGPCRVDDAADYYFITTNYDSVRSITGPLNYTHSDTKIEPRLAYDVVEAGGFTRIQRIQQVRYSDLLKTPMDQMSDVSYLADPTQPNMAGDTVTVKGVVTMPTGLSYAGDGIKFIFSEPEGGPWSGILSYHSDSTAYPVLFEGDEVEMTGYIGEYRSGTSNMTEFWLTSTIQITNIGQPIPDPDLVTTGDLRLPVTGEQWGNGMVYFKDAEVVDLLAGGYELFAVDDGSGSVYVDDDSDSLANYADPPFGSIADSIRGWVYHHYGAYTDCTTYKLCPLYTSDIVWGGGGPPAMSQSDVRRDIGIPTPADAVTISAEVVTSLTITDVSLYYTLNATGSYTQVSMPNTGGDTYEGLIPSQALGTWVDYFVIATDNQAQTTMVPFDTSVQNLCYPVTDGSLNISDIQYTRWETADSPFEGYNVEITGIVTTDTASNNNYNSYGIQDAESQWSGLLVFDISSGLFQGDEITVYGTVTDYNDYNSYRWDNNTVILVDSFTLGTPGTTMNSMPVLTGDLAGTSPGVESYEGTLVNITNATLMSVNSYDVSFDDGSGECLVDDDFIHGSYFNINSTDGYLYAFGDTIWPGEVVDAIHGIFIWSYGSYKIEVRDVNDFGSIVGINPDYEPIPLTYKLNQNFPNPFNPETRIYFEIPEQHDVKIAIYNMLGQKVRMLINEPYNAGRHTVNWDGRDDIGNLVSTGVYFYRIQAGDFIASMKMIMMK